MSRELTLNFGLRYENFRPPYEANGLQVDTTVPLESIFRAAQRLAAAGRPGESDVRLHAQLCAERAGERETVLVESRTTRISRRASDSPMRPADHGGLVGKLFGKNGRVPRRRCLAYDQFGNDLIVQLRSVRLAGSLQSDQFSRFLQLHHVAAFHRHVSRRCRRPPPADFPYTPPAIAAITGTFLGISPDLKTPYSIMLNADYSRELPGKVTMEVGYMGRLSRRLLMEGDVYTPLENYKDPGSGITWQQNAQTVYNLANTLAQSAPAFLTTTPRPWSRRR